MNPPPASSIDHPLRSHPVLSSATPPPTLSIPTGSLLEQQNPHVQSGNNNANAEGHLERMVGTHGNSSRPTDSAELDRMDNTIRLIRHLRSLRSRLQYNVDRPIRASEEEWMERLEQLMQEAENALLTAELHMWQQERRSLSVRQEQSEDSGPRDILNEPRTSIRASTTSSLLEHSNMPVSPVRRQQASQQMRDLSYSFGRFDEPLDEGGFHSQENSTNNHPRRRRQEVPQRPLAEQGQLLYDSLLRPHPPHPPRPSPELTSNFHAADQNSISPLQLPSRAGIEQSNAQQHATNNGSRTVQARPRERARMQAAPSPENKNTD
ncbi:predicted protein [Sclerotinia sclerotiorum 1980 UF-70]|nr:predicted protein [Sclerotinia sclerotiorum 1980 UF-70]EDN94888.1 predicted protein [Sclerotinia sclerotiorum 1980 UF-70]